MQNLKLLGTQTIEGGEYGNILVSGTFTTKNNVKCQEIKISGSSTLNGDFMCSGESHFSGSVNCLGSFNAKNTHISGCFTTENAKVDNLAVSGNIHSKGDIEVENIKTSGSVYANNITAKLISINGAVKCSNDIKADDIHIKMYFCHKGKANNIVCENLLINSNWTKKLFGRHSYFTVSLIQGNDINVDYVKCDKICGKNVKLGKHCIVGTVEYTDSCDIADGATISVKKRYSI